MFDNVTIVVPGPTTLSLDILPSDDPNLFVPNTQGKGKKGSKIPMAIFATEDVAAEDIDPVSILIAGVIGPLKTSTDKDVDGDGLVDLVMHFSRRELIDVLDILFGEPVEVGDVVDVTVTAALEGDGCLIEATDSIVIAAHED